MSNTSLDKPSQHHIYLATFLISASSLMLEILLTRIFSVTMSYHFAFLVVSLAIFGISAGSLLVYIYKKSHFEEQKNNIQLGRFSFIYAISVIITGLSLFTFQFDLTKGNFNLYMVTINIIVSLIPFVINGIIVSILLTNYSKKVEKIYAADLGGAAFGCVLIVGIINALGIVSSLLFISLLGMMVSSLFFALSKKSIWTKVCKVFSGMIIIFVVFIYFFSSALNPIFYLSSLKGDNVGKILFEKWNTYSRVTVREENQPSNIDHLGMRIDADAYTPIYRFNGNLSPFSFLKSDIVNVAHHLRPHARVLIVGAGGGKDIVSSLVFHQPSITGVEINSTITGILLDTFKEYSGDLAHQPGVTLVNAEARSFISSRQNKYDIIIVSFIDTWAASSSGAYSLTENGLYTTQAYCNFLNAVSDKGVISFTRWYTKTSPYEVLRLYVLAQESLKQCKGVKTPENNIIVLNKMLNKEQTIGSATLLFSSTAFSDTDTAIVDTISQKYGFEKLSVPKREKNEIIKKLLAMGYTEYSKKTHSNLAPPTDDSPYFFQLTKPYQVLNISAPNNDTNTKNNISVITLVATFLLLLFFSIGLVVIPLWKLLRNKRQKKIGYFLLYFLCIGFAYMLIEISIIQRLSIFLGHPSLGLILVLSTLLISSSIGSLYSVEIHKKIDALKIVIVTVIIVGIISPRGIQLFTTYGLAVRCFISIAILFPTGLVMGFCFPLGINKLLGSNSQDAAAWLLSINGAASVMGSTLAIIIAMSSSITLAYTVGVLCYIGAYISFLKISSSEV